MGSSAYGGGVWGVGVKLIQSVVSNSQALSTSSASGGGGITAGAGGLEANDTTVSDNRAASYGVNWGGSGGGVWTDGAAVFQRSTISGNEATFGGGLFGVHGVAMANSTVADNKAIRGYGAMRVDALVSLYNTTVAFNEAYEVSRLGGVVAASTYARSSLLANNVTWSAGGVVESDVKSNDGIVSGSHNFIKAANVGTTVPMDTLAGCPRIAPLFNNGGPTFTVALLPYSPAIDFGYDPYDTTDQRGPGFERLVGANVDIGAFEWSDDSGEVINRSGFELCE